MAYSYPAMDASYNKQQFQSYLEMPQQHWLLQQPHIDSGYAEGGEDLFAQAFKSYEPNMQSIDQWVMEAQPTPALSHSSSTPSPFEYADSLVVPSRQWHPYETTFSTSYCLDGPTHTVPTYESNFTYMSSPPTMSKQDQEDLSQPPVLQPSLMEDSCSPAESPMIDRPRQREHHTAVEQRYRKNLNDQFTNLRSAIPNIHTSQPQRGGQPAKPSKSEVLAAAADYIKQLEGENRKLKALAQDEADASRKRARTMV